MPEVPDRSPALARRGWKFCVRFSLRTLLGFITAVALVCWWYARPISRTEEIAGKDLVLQRQVSRQRLPRPPTATLHVNQRDQRDRNAINVGRWRVVDAQGDLLVRGRFRNDQRHGAWTIYHANGRQAAQGELFHGARVKLWKTWDEQGQLRSEVTYAAIQREPAIWRPTLPRHPGMTTVIPVVGLVGLLGQSPLVGLAPSYGDALISVRHGPMRAWYPNGELKCEGAYEHDRRHGLWTCYDQRGRVTARGEYRDDQREGKWLLSNPGDGQTIEVEYWAGSPRQVQEQLLARLKADITSGDLRRQALAVDHLERLGALGLPLLVLALDQEGLDTPLCTLEALERMTSPLPQDRQVNSPARPVRRLPLPRAALARIDELAASDHPRLRALAMLVVFRERPDDRQRLTNALFESAKRSTDENWPQYVLETIYAVDHEHRAATLAEAARCDAGWTGAADAPWDGGDFVRFINQFSDLPVVLQTASQSSDPTVRSFVLTAINQLASEEALMTGRWSTAGGRWQYAVPAAYRQIVERAKSDSNSAVRDLAKTIGGVF